MKIILSVKEFISSLLIVFFISKYCSILGFYDYDSRWFQGVSTKYIANLI